MGKNWERGICKLLFYCGFEADKTLNYKKAGQQFPVWKNDALKPATKANIIAKSGR
ncbi:MAG: hypothetical protein H6557_10410 [Lewinellaceae bacterium]|nr:hypothetical protein [Lewinellaceae bacterium]